MARVKVFYGQTNINIESKVNEMNGLPKSNPGVLKSFRLQ